MSQSLISQQPQHGEGVGDYEICQTTAQPATMPELLIQITAGESQSAHHLHDNLTPCADGAFGRQSMAHIYGAVVHAEPVDVTRSGSGCP